ncbi:hypothetical protein BDV93DRAFT_565082 [Ceratobasidium sp. AG-I]|nr:hypothetical protein BDV93DRAFT_565082 [Ceratobasidium sp. AG-I]
MSSPLDSRLLQLLLHLRQLPTSLSDHPSIYPFLKFELDPYDINHYGSAQAALHHRLELIFGSRNGGRQIEFRGRGSSLESIVYIFYKHINGEGGDNRLLWNWVEELTRAAAECLKRTLEIQPGSAQPSSHSQRTKQQAVRLPQTKRPEAWVRAAKESTAIRVPHDPADLEDDPVAGELATGRARHELLDKLTVPCHSIVNPTQKRYRCSGVGCWHSWAAPRASTRVLKHAYNECKGLNPELRPEVERRSAFLSLARKVQDHRKDTESGTTVEISQDNPEAQRQKEEKVNHALLKWICDRMIPPSAVDCFRWRELMDTLDSGVKTASGDTISGNFVTTEAAYIHQESIKVLSKHENLTLSYDGGTTKKHESVYTVHATVPSTREACLVEGNGASGVSHTAEHVCGVIEHVLTQVGPEKSACVVSDNAGNTRATRSLLEQEYPWIITLQDACHH